jgi:hypothetical protein
MVKAPWPDGACNKPNLTECARCPPSGSAITRLPKNNLGAFVSVLGWNAGLVSSRPLGGAEAPITLICTALSSAREPELHEIVNP